MNVKRGATSHLSMVFGPLEVRVLEALWARGAAAAVKDLLPGFPGVAYTTLMTTLDRLYRKGALSRTKSGRAFVYQPTATHDELVSQVAGHTLASLLGSDAAVRPVLSQFVDTVGERDHALLDELEALVRARRQALTDKGTP
jgi:predicted transcriptional regulator